MVCKMNFVLDAKRQREQRGVGELWDSTFSKNVHVPRVRRNDRQKISLVGYRHAQRRTARVTSHEFLIFTCCQECPFESWNEMRQYRRGQRVNNTFGLSSITRTDVYVKLNRIQCKNSTTKRSAPSCNRILACIGIYNWIQTYSTKYPIAQRTRMTRHSVSRQ